MSTSKPLTTPPLPSSTSSPSSPSSPNSTTQQNTAMPVPSQISIGWAEFNNGAGGTYNNYPRPQGNLTQFNYGLTPDTRNYFSALYNKVGNYN